MKDRRRVKYVHEGRYVAEVEVDLIESDESWSPCLSLDDTYKLDEVRMALVLVPGRAPGPDVPPGLELGRLLRHAVAAGRARPHGPSAS